MMKCNEAKQRTLMRPVTCSGLGLHSGKSVSMILHPAPINHGIQFMRADLPNKPRITAHFSKVVDTSLATVIGSDGIIVSTIEHLMAAFAGLSIDNVLVELSAYEVPLMDGSAGPFTSMILESGIREQEGPRCMFVVKKTISIQEGDKSVTVYPSSDFRITCTIDFPHPLIQKQTYSLAVQEENFHTEISFARTFGFLHEVEFLKHYGLARGGSLSNAIVLDEKGMVNQDGLRYPDEFVRHKLLDAIGDFSLIGIPILGHIVLNKSGHAFNHAFLEKFFASRSSWETVTHTETILLPKRYASQAAV